MRDETIHRLALYHTLGQKDQTIARLQQEIDQYIHLKTMVGHERRRQLHAIRLLEQERNSNKKTHVHNAQLQQERDVLIAKVDELEAALEQKELQLKYTRCQVVYNAQLEKDAADCAQKAAATELASHGQSAPQKYTAAWWAHKRAERDKRELAK